MSTAAPSKSGPRVVIVGGGVAGCATALRLAEREPRAEVLVLERSVPGAEASSAAGGILGPAIEASHPSAVHHGIDSLAFSLRARRLHHELAARLRVEHGIDIGYRECGLYRVAYDDAEHTELLRHQGIVEGHAPVELIDGDEARHREPAFSPEIRSALYFEGEGQLEPKPFLRALAVAAERAGVRFRSGAYVEEVVVAGERVRGVRVGGELLEADAVVVAAGSWTSLVPGLTGELLAGARIQPVRGQMLASVTRPPLFRSVVFGAGGYVITRPDGRILTGSTEEHVGFRREVTFAGMRRIFDIALRLAPRLADAPVLDAWSSFRPGTADGLPLVGPAGPAGLYLASGHFRSGILLSTVTAEIIETQLFDRPRDAELPRLEVLVDPRRFVG